ncbi:MAG: type II toxin-antitoxin system HicA family toxin [Defluviitaleaceae bacterium]|nr:type II toxin-antitoxin system HicA family toxin [Defluviitaleaceae bacterium]
MTMTGKELVNRLKRNGWKLDRVHGSHHIMIKEGYLPATVPVHGNKDIPKGTLNQLLKDTGLKGR